MLKTTAMKQKLEEITGYRLRGEAYVLQAFTRSSYTEGESNEILEMYGDAILGYFAMQLVHERYGFFRTVNHVNYKGDSGYALRGIRNEAQLDAIKKKLVCNETLAKQIDKWDLAKYLIMGRSDVINRVGEHTKTKADLFEAILGAYAVTYNFNNDVLKTIVERMLPVEDVFSEVNQMNDAPGDLSVENAITTLKEMAEQRICSQPEYSFGGPEHLGYYSNGDPMWCCNCSVQSLGFSTAIFSNSKKTAKKCAAYQAICKYYELTNDIAQYKCVGNKRIIEKDGRYIVEEAE